MDDPGRRTRGRRPVAAALVTMGAVFAATLGIFSLVNTIRSGPSLTTLTVGVPMVIGDMIIALPLIWIVLAAARDGWHRRWPVVVASGVAVILLQTVYDTFVRVAVGAVPAAQWNAPFVSSLSVNSYHTGMLIAILGFQAAYHRVADGEERLAAAWSGERRAQLASLRLQLNPHFLFNGMNALSSLVVVGRNREAEAMIEKLTAFLRNLLSTDTEAPVRLDEEFGLVESYVAIEQVRFGDRLTVIMTLPPDLAKLTVPAFVLQPLVENAMKYAVAASPRAVTVAITAERAENRLLLRVADDGPGAAEGTGGTGLGLANVRQRLALQYGERATLTAVAGADGYTAEICIPLDS